MLALLLAGIIRTTLVRRATPRTARLRRATLLRGSVLPRSSGTRARSVRARPGRRLTHLHRSTSSGLIRATPLGPPHHGILMRFGTRRLARLR
ncbi:hypothetical protein AB0E01_24520 [Nocardia vinacea]|uniref:hypothetical protein n=1 Tax=Nocardia vinacea TaxID=96468 RepID=UPI0034049644